MNAGQQKFLDRYARSLLVGWAHHDLVYGGLPEIAPENEGYLAFAISKGWVAKNRLKVNAKGYTVAASFLKV